MGRKGVPKDKRERRYIHIGDYGLWELIDEIAQADKYNKDNIENDFQLLFINFRDFLISKGVTQ